VISGWAADLIDGAPASNVKACTIGRNLAGTPTLGVLRARMWPRPRVAAYLDSGYTLTYPVAGARTGARTPRLRSPSTRAGARPHLDRSPLCCRRSRTCTADRHIDLAVDSVTASTTVGRRIQWRSEGWAADLVDSRRH